MTAAEHAAGLNDYIEAGVARAKALNNRGPVRYDRNGKLHPDILDAYWEHGFYVFEGIIKADELAELQADAQYLLEHAPVDSRSNVDASGRPAIGNEFTRPTFTYIKPLSDPWGGTELLGGRHPTQMVQPSANDSAPEEVLFLIHGMCQVMPSGLRMYGHADILAIAEAINGEDFTPYNDILFVKPPGLGGSVSWHQDGVTHWDSPDWDEGIHGFNFQVQLYECTPRNALWVMPGTHKLGRMDIQQLVADNGGCEQLPGAVPLMCKPGDATIVNRQALHCSFANTSDKLRVSLTFGFHRRASVLGATGALSQKANEVYDAERIFERSRIIALAIDARAQHFPNEPRFDYAPFRGLLDQYRYNDTTKETILRDYNLKDLSI
jgi:ectoine hydroxylase-related dioxygenase (phytanoyl-CoA dioxygenase family)